MGRLEEEEDMAADAQPVAGSRENAADLSWVECLMFSVQGLENCSSSPHQQRDSMSEHARLSYHLGSSHGRVVSRLAAAVRWYGGR